MSSNKDDSDSSDGGSFVSARESVTSQALILGSLSQRHNSTYSSNTKNRTSGASFATAKNYSELQGDSFVSA